MNISPNQIEMIVGEVVRRLKELRSSTPASAVLGRTNELVLVDAVVTMQHVSGRLTGMQRLVVRPRAIVTPAVQDELRKQKVQLDRREGASAQVGQVRLLLVAADNAAEKEISKLNLTGSERIESQATSSLAGTMQELARQMASRTVPALVVSSQPFAAVVEANRQSGLRAASVNTAEQVQQAFREAAANLFVVAVNTSPFTLRKIGEQVAGCV